MRFRIPKISSIKYRVNEFYNNLHKAYVRFWESSLVNHWIKKKVEMNDIILVGANYAPNNGIGNHIHSIQCYSNLKVELFPSDYIINRLGIYKFQKIFESKQKTISLNGNTVLHSHVYPWYIHWCYKMKMEKGLGWIHTYHAPYQSEYALNGLSEWQLEFNRVWIEVARFADVKISVSKWQQKYYQEKHAIETIYIPNGVDVVRCDSADSISFKKEIGVDEFILNVSRHDPVKNPGEFVKLAERIPSFQFVIIGPGLSIDIFEKEYGIKPPPNLLIYGEASIQTVQSAIAACSVLVSTSKKEGLPTLVLEGMAHGKPVIVSNEPGSMEAIDHGAYGLFYELGDIEDLKEKTLLAINDNSIGEKARQRVLDEYDWRIISQKLDCTYKILLNDNN
jgi:glycosyltransferase involved in cell wall biosynthesis